MTGYLRAIWSYRYFWLALVRMDLRARFQGSWLGMGWSLVRPLTMTAILCTVFHRIFHVDPWEFAPFLLAGLGCWQFLCAIIVDGAKCFVQGEVYIRQHPAPLAIYPLRVTLGAMVHLMLAIGIALGLKGYAGGFESLPALLSLLPSLVILFLFGWAMATLMGLANAFFRDVQPGAEVSLQILFYATPVLYPGRVLRDYRLEWISAHNPLVAFISLIRDPIVEGHVASAHACGFALATTFAMGLLASFALARLQRRLVFYL